MRDPFSIRLKPDAQPYAVFAPRHIPLPLLPKVKEKIDRLLQLDAITRVEERMLWAPPSQSQRNKGGWPGPPILKGLRADIENASREKIVGQ